MKQNFLAVLYQAMWRYSKGFRWVIPVFMVLLTTGMIMVQITPYLFGRIITDLQHFAAHPDQPLDDIQFSLMWYAIVTICFWAFHGPGRIVERRFSFRVRQAALNDLYDKAQALPLEWHQDHHSGSVTDRMRNATIALQAFTGSQFRIVSAVVGTIVPLLFLWFTARPLALICMVGGLTALLTIVSVDKKLVPILYQKRELGHRLTALLIDYISNIQSVMTLRLGRQTKKELSHRLHLEQPVEHREAVWTEMKWGVMDTIINITRVIVILYLVYAFKQGTMRDLGVIVASIQYIQTFASVFANLSVLYEQTVRQSSEFQSVQIIVDAYHEHHRPDDDYVDLPPFHRMSIRDLGFSYKNSQAGHGLRSVNLDFSLGQKIALVGESGSGKSTVMKLLRGLYAVDSGQLELDGKNQPLGVLAAQTTLIPQEPEIFENTIRYNITMGVDYDDAAILEACRIACFDTVLGHLPRGLDTDIREKGVNLSGGQKQRLALARGVFAIQDSAVILLDEPTSSVDSMTEQRIYDNLFAAFPEKCVVSSIHRLHLLSQFDKIYVFEKGQVVQAGSLNDLVGQDGLFKTMWQAYQNAQSQGA